MNENQVTIHSLVIPEIEAVLTTFQMEVFEQVRLQGKQDAQRPSILTRTEFAVLVRKPIEAKGTSLINRVHQQSQLWAKLHNTKELEVQAGQQCDQLQFAYNDKERQVLPLEKLKEALSQCTSKLKYWSWFIIASIICGCADGLLAYSSFRFAYPSYLAAITALVVTAAISCSHFAYAPWIKKANRVEKWLKIAAVLAIAGIFFFWIASLRVAALNSVVSIDPLHPEVQHAPLSATAIAGISFVLFIFVFALSLRFWISPEEKKQHEEYIKVCAAVDALKNDMAMLKAQKEKLQNDVLKQKSEVRGLANYIKRTFETIVAIARAACEEYKKVYGQFRHEMPVFFAEESDLHCDTDLKLFDLQKELQ